MNSPKEQCWFKQEISSQKSEETMNQLVVAKLFQAVVCFSFENCH